MAGATGLLDGDIAEPSTKSEVLKSTGGSLPAPIVPLPTLPQVLHPKASPLGVCATDVRIPVYSVFRLYKKLFD